VSRRSALLPVIREAIPFRSHPSCDVQLGAEGDIFAAAPGGPDRIGVVVAAPTWCTVDGCRQRNDLRRRRRLL